MNLADVIESIQAALPDKPSNELKQDDVTQAMVQFVQQTLGMTDEAAGHYTALVNHTLYQGCKPTGERNSANRPGERSARAEKLHCR